MSSPKQRKCCDQYCVKNLSPEKTKALKMQDVANINWRNNFKIFNRFLLFHLDREKKIANIWELYYIPQTCGYRK